MTRAEGSLGPENPSGAAEGAVVDAGELVDSARLSAFHLRLLLLAAAAIILDGLDTQVLGFAAPTLMADWGVTKAALAPVLAIGLVGMVMGTTLGGMVGDRFGRRAALIASMLIFGLATGAMAAAGSIPALIVLRLAAGIGMGGAIPNAFALVAEFSPLSRRSVLLTACIVCVPLGGVLGGVLASTLLPAGGWRALLAVSGSAPVALAAVLAWALPESPRFLAQRPERWPRLRALLPRLGLALPPDARFTRPVQEVRKSGSIVELWRSDFRRDTLLLWVAFFLCLAAVFLNFNWLPSMLVGAGYGRQLASLGLLAFNVGGVLAALLVAWVIAYAGSRRPLTLLAGGGALVAILLHVLSFAAARYPPGLLLALGVMGAGSSGLQALLYTLTSSLYPTGIRATGMGAAASVGRLGAILATFGGAYILAAYGQGGFYLAVAILLGGTAAALVGIRRHIRASR